MDPTRPEPPSVAGVCSPDGLLWVSSLVETVVNHYPNECTDRANCLDWPVNGKTYTQAQEYCEYIGGRLCTEAEWERAANGPGPERRLHPWGDEDPTYDRANLESTGEGFINRVASHMLGRSVEGVYNLAGNVYEWVEDRYAQYPWPPAGEVVSNPRSLPVSDQDEFVMRGSCFFTTPEHTVSERSVMPPIFDWG